MKDYNQLYFNMLLQKSKNTNITQITLYQPEAGVESKTVALAIANAEDLKTINIKNYSELTEQNAEKLNDITYALVKMQAGLGSSVKRTDLIKKIENREKLGAKGTDLYFEVGGKLLPIAEIQLLQAHALSKNSKLKKIKYINLVNNETQVAVENIWSKKYLDSNYQDFFDANDKLEIGETYFQKTMPTLNENGELTTERMAPAGHGFIGFSEILNILNNPNIDNEILTIGNGEDLASTPDLKIINWIVEENLPIVMLTTTKTADDKKGGQISIVKGSPNYVTIVEKAQAEAAGQLEYFEELGLREGDNQSLFNTNIVVINKKALKEKFNQFLGDVSNESFVDRFAPDVIKNIKEQDGKKFTQLESALGSVMLNLDSYFRLNFDCQLVSFLNLSPNERELFFMPIKKREDYEDILIKYSVDPVNFKLTRTL